MADQFGQQYTMDLQSEPKARAQADYICVAKLLEEGLLEPEGMDMVYHYNALVEVGSEEKGNMQEIGKPTCRLSFATRTMENGKRLPQLEKGKSYRFYIRKSTTTPELRTFRITDL
jgi:hypothetical protein